MYRSLCCMLILATVAAPVWAQKSAMADKQAASWFNNNRDAFLKRTGTLVAGDLDAFETAAKKAGVEASRQQLFFTLPKFNPLFDSKDLIVAGAIAKHAKRLEQIPPKVIEEWKVLTGGEQFVAALAITAENSVFPGEKYSEQGFRALATKFK
jgi:hypothetical protein